MKISVIMPVYNTKEEYLREAIESILNQTFQDFEFIIIDDGSEDYVKEIIKSYNDKRIKYIKNEKNLGLITTLNKGLEIAHGEYIARMDSDDVSLPTRFEKQVAYMDKNLHVGALGTWTEVFPKTEIWKPQEKFTYFNFLKWNPFITHPSVMLRSNAIKNHQIKYDNRFEVAEDYDFWRQILHVSEIHNLQEVLLKYRIDGNNISLKRKEKSKESFQKIQKIAYDFLTTDKELQEKIKILLNRHGKKKQLKYHIKYNIYKGLWLLGGKGNFYKSKMQKTKRKMKGL